ncbi:MAG: hypothetical protein CL774_01815 [Chloroflexi bacterium]|nr:hypothetical protein [Chloroflexota bacterium]|tara:strand:- start:1944 stop:3680 length:1737 start_codon:yes stop_codon:yes gene_type:complete
MTKILKNKIAIISDFINPVIAQVMSMNGAKLVVNFDSKYSKNISFQNKFIEKINSLGGEIYVANESISDFNNAKNLIDFAVDKFGGVDIVFCTKDYKQNKTIQDMGENDWDKIYLENLKGTFNIVRHISPLLRKQKFGRIITLSANSGLLGASKMSSYSATKSGIVGFSKVIAKDLGKYGVTSNTISYDDQNDSLEVSSKNNNTLENIASFATYLASDYSAPVNGQIFQIEDGRISHFSLPRRNKTFLSSSISQTFEIDEIDSNIESILLNNNKKLPQYKNLSGKVAIVTGASGGIGKEIAKLLAAEGASIVVADIGSSLDGSSENSEPALKIVEEINELGGNAVASLNTVTSMAGAKNIIDDAISNFGKLDILVAAAGILRDRMIFNMSEQEWDDVLSVHFKGTFSVVKASISHLIKQKFGRIITFSSVSGLYGYGGQSNYGAAKEGISGFTKSLSKELFKYGVTANIISPGAKTRMTESVPDKTLSMRKGDFKIPEDILSNHPSQVPPMIAWLASDASSNVTGKIFHCVGNRISLMKDPSEYRSINKKTKWFPEEIAAIFPETIGMDLINPAPISQ